MTQLFFLLFSLERNSRKTTQRKFNLRGENQKAQHLIGRIIQSATNLRPSMGHKGK
jgi:hypothetical protein